MKKIEIKLVNQNEFKETENVVRESFWGVFRPGCVEHFILHRARENNLLVKALDYCVKINDKIIGHIMYSHANIILNNGVDQDVLVLGPVCILPEYQKKGYGSQLINFTLSLATQYGYGAVVVVGNPKLFAKFGFIPAQQKQINYAKTGKDKPSPFFLVKELQHGYLAKTSGTFVPTEVFDISIDEATEYDKNFTPKAQKIHNNKITIKI